MDIIDNLLYASHASPMQPTNPPSVLAVVPRVTSDYIVSPSPTPLIPPPSLPNLPRSYDTLSKMDFCSFADTKLLDRSIQRHWFDIDNQFVYTENGTQVGGYVGLDRLIGFDISSNYHLINAYLLENTRIIQIFQKLLEKYKADEGFGISGDSTVVKWLNNTERLFFKGDSYSYGNLRSLIRPDSEMTRRNAYWRMFGMDLAFGDPDSKTTSVQYLKANSSNQQFIIVFEKYLSEIWRGYINATNTSGENTTDLNIITNLSQQLSELLLARRGSSVLSYSNQNLSQEEFSSVLIASWFTFIISYDSPVVQFLNCQSSTIGERLMKIGSKVGIPAHGKCQHLFEMAGSASVILNTVETNVVLNDPTWVTQMLNMNPGAPAVMMNNFLTVINNWENATGHNIKNQSANIRGNVTLQQNGARISTNGTMPKPAMN